MESFESKNFPNSSRPTEQQIRQTDNPTTMTEESLWVILDEIEILREQIDYWRNIEALKNGELHRVEQKLREANKELDALYQELMYTNKELGDALKFQSKNLAEVKELATTILASEKSASECLAEFISIIYDIHVNSEELELNAKLNKKTQLLKNYINNNEIIAESSELINKFKVQFNQFKTQFAVLKNNYNQIVTEITISSNITDQRQEN